jgi:RsiW-degrading membrane proteinase PrsW (M82 family)
MAEQTVVFQPGERARIGRGADNDVTTSDQFVSRQHAVMSWAGDCWVFENIGQAPTFLNGQPVTQLAVREPLILTLGSLQGPVLRVDPSSAADSQPTFIGQSFPAGGAAPRAAKPAGPSREELAEALQIFFPIRNWILNSGWRQVLAISYAVLPLVFIAVFSRSGNLTTPGWSYSLYIAPLWAMGFWLVIRPGMIEVLQVKIGIWIVVSILIWINVVTIRINDALDLHRSISLFPAICIAINEEVAKALPILVAGLFLLKYRSIRLDVRMWMFLATISGLTFGVAEQAFYTATDIVVINQARSPGEAVIAVFAFVERILVDGFQHAVWAGIAGFFIGMALNYPRRRLQLIVAGVAIPVILHALNDWLEGDSVWAAIVIQAASVFLLLGYSMSASWIEEQVRRAPLFGGDPMVMEEFATPGSTSGFDN